jgi:hypothetical protein
MRTRSRALAVVLSLSALSLAAAACGSSSASPSTTSTTAARSPSAALLAAVHSSASQSSADIGMRVNATVGSKAIQVAAHGTVDLASSAMQMTMAFVGVPEFSGTTISLILVDGTVYVSFPQISTIAPGKTWIAAPVSSSTTSGVQFSNASDLLKMLAAKGAVVTKSGVGTIGSTPVTQYSVTIPPGAITSQIQGLKIPASDSAEVEQIAQGGITFHVFVTPANQIRRLSLQMAVPASSSTPAGKESIVLDFTNYGVPVSISAPPASEVATSSSLNGASA